LKSVAGKSGGSKYRTGILKPLGVTANQSSRWQKAADVPEPVVDEYFNEVESSGGEVTNAGLLRYHRDVVAQVRKQDKRHVEDAARAGADESVPTIRTGRFQDVLEDIPDGSVDLIVTDPPYGPKYNDAYLDLAEWAARKLKPGGSCIAYAGQSNLPDVLSVMSKHLRYWWTLALMHKHGAQQLPGKWVMVEWKPVVWFVREARNNKSYVADRMTGSKPRKDLHEWAQGVDEVCYLIEQLTQPGDLVVDPFAGSGSFGYAALSMGRKFIGAESGDHKDAR
jgi:site-specific DNA-methyltransferase (adenine-specific)